MNKGERLVGNSELLRTFVAVADCKNITHAGHALGKTQSAISVQTKKLEAILEVSLFERQARGLTLTSEGEKLLPFARSVISELRQIGNAFDNQLEGRLRVGIPDDYTESVLENTLVKFAERHPLVEVTARFGCTSGFPAAVRQGNLDVAVVADANVPVSSRITSEPNLWVAATSFIGAGGQPVPLAILDRRNCSWRTFASDALSAVGRPWRVAYESESFAGVKSAVRSGLAVSVLPQSLVESNMKVLTEEDGFPLLPVTQRGILISETIPKDVAEAMADAIRAATMLPAGMN